jgi:serine/threonine protein kinase HipA of HipAB toxin-antitoxin module
MATRTSRISGLFMTTFREKRDSHPVYDLVTTSAYLPKDSMALTLNGTTKWASAKELQRLGETRMGATPSRVRQILERIEAAIAAPQRICKPTLKRTRNSLR